MKAKINGNEVTYKDKAIMLMPAHVKLFTELQWVYPKVITNEYLIDMMGYTKKHTLTQQISTLRKKLKAFEAFEIVTHSKVGYSLKIKGE